MSKRVSVHHFVAAATVSQAGQHPTSNLLGVDYIRDVPADTEFPRVSGRFDLFTRFYLKNAAPAEFALVVTWLDSPDAGRRRVWRSPAPHFVSFRPDEIYRDHVFRIHSILLPGVGRYRIVLARYQPADYLGRTRGKIAMTHFLVER